MTKANFDSFLAEADAHFKAVLNKLPGFENPQELKFKIGASSLVIRFRVEKEYFIFRVPKYSQRQIRAYLLAYQHFSATGLMPEKIYHDEKCVVERLVPGHELTERLVGDCELEKLAAALLSLHLIPAIGFGRIVYGCEGENKSLADCFSTYVEKGINWLEEHGVMDDMRLSHLREIMAVLPEPAEKNVFICHGDMSAPNIIVDSDRVRFVDWDGLCAFPREYEFSYLNIEPKFHHHMKRLIYLYGHPLNVNLINYFSFGNVLRTICTAASPFDELWKFTDIFDDLLLRIQQV